MLTEISEDVWDEVIGDLASVTVFAEEQQSRPQEMLDLVTNQGVSTGYGLSTRALTGSRYPDKKPAQSHYIEGC